MISLVALHTNLFKSMFGFWVWILLIHISRTFALASRKIGFIRGDIMIGALFPIHEQPTIERSYSRECGQIREQYGMHRVEVLLKTIDEINKNPNILPGITLGVDIRDTCWYSPIALEQSIDFIKNSIAHQEKFEKEQTFQNLDGSGKAIAGLIGPASSTVTIQVQNLLQLFKIPQIGYSATSIDLSRKNEYKYFLRVVPSDKLQVKALIDLVRHHNWNYISLLNSIGNYGTQGIKELQDHLEDIKSICTDQEIEVDNKEEMPKFREIAEKLFAKERAKVVLCFCQGETVTKLLQAMSELNMTGKGFLIVGTDGWADRTDVLGNLIDSENGQRDLSSAALGSISIRLHSKSIPDFDKYFRSKSYNNTKGNPWFQEFWEQKFKCSFNLSTQNKNSKLCTGNESLFNHEDYVQDSKLGFVVKSVMTVAMGLDSLYRKLCQPGKNCPELLKLNGTLLLQEMLNVSFLAYDNETVSFDSKGDPPGRYDIMNYQDVYDAVTKRNMFKYQKVGTWKDDKLVIDKEIQWPKTNSGPNIPVQSQCSLPCKIDEIRVFTKGKRCCWKCRSCLKTEYITSTSLEEKCVPCEEGHIPTYNRSGCVEIPPYFIQWSDVTSIIAVVFSCVGILTTVAITVIFAKFNNTPVVKSSTRELMYFILVGIALSFLTTFPLLTKPSDFSCTLSRIIPGLSFSLIYGSLVTKTNRICRILAISKKKIIRRKGRFLTTTAQIVIVVILNIIEIIIIAVTLALEPAHPIKEFPTWNKTNLVCNTSPRSLFIPMGFDAVLVCFCTWYAFKTRNLPENFNEAKFIGFTMYTTCIIWVGLVVIYFGAEYKVISLCFAINLSATVAIVLLFMPKVYIILFRPEKNERSAFTTTNEIRCHIGSGKVEYQCSKEKSQLTKSSSQQNLKYPTDLRKCSMDHISYKISLNPQSFDNGYAKAVSNKEVKVTQTEFSLIVQYLFDISNCLEKNSDELNITQIALLQFLEENWYKDHIPLINKCSNQEKMLPELSSVEERTLDFDEISDNLNEDTENDSSSVKHPMITQSNSVVTCSPISNVSTDASSTINAMFVEHLQQHGKQFKNNSDKKSVKL